ncbi:MAG TPA: NADH:flavin oxidoreductase [Armatimonadota bacterium]|jgi:2,4-dienoyl-CoA reductase-like NADH-dependent reductase (Old Yellow Enzyme family)
MSQLFSPFTVRGLTFPSRLVMPPMVMAGQPGMEDAATAADPVTDQRLLHYAERARGGTGLVIVEATAVEPAGRVWPGGLTAYREEDSGGLTRLVHALVASGAVPSIQLVHGGPSSPPELVGQVLSPSAYQPGLTALTGEKIADIQEQFVQAAVRCVRAGFPAVEVHGAHGFLLDSFLMAERNQRTDQYGGSPEGRRRMLVETCAALRECVGDCTVLMCRISPFTKLPGEVTPENLRDLVTALAEAGVDFLDVSTDGVFKGWFDSDRTLGQWVQEFTDLPVMVTGGVRTAEQAERVIAEGHGQFVGVATAMLRNPAWAAEARAVLG